MPKQHPAQNWKIGSPQESFSPSPSQQSSQTSRHFDKDNEVEKVKFQVLVFNVDYGEYCNGVVRRRMSIPKKKWLVEFNDGSQKWVGQSDFA